MRIRRNPEGSRTAQAMRGKCANDEFGRIKEKDLPIPNGGSDQRNAQTRRRNAKRHRFRREVQATANEQARGGTPQDEQASSPQVGRSSPQVGRSSSQAGRSSSQAGRSSSQAGRSSSQAGRSSPQAGRSSSRNERRMDSYSASPHLLSLSQNDRRLQCVFLSQNETSWKEKT